MIVCRLNLETKGHSPVMAMPCAKKFISLFMRS